MQNYDNLVANMMTVKQLLHLDNLVRMVCCEQLVSYVLVVEMV